MSDPPHEPPAPPLAEQRSSASAVLCLGLAALASVAWVLLPHGFPWDHPRFWSNQALPLLLVGASLAVGSRKQTPTRTALSLWFGVALSGALTCLVLFPASFWRVAWLPLALAYLLWRRSRREGRGRERWPALISGLLLGAALGFAQRGPDASTRPAGGDLAAVTSRSRPSANVGPAELDPSGAAALRIGNTWVRVDPLLRFRSRSPDRCWTLLANAAHHRRLPLRLAATASQPGRTRLAWDGPHPASLDLRWTGAALEIDARRTLTQPVYSHLNRCLDVWALDPGAAYSLRFSPCPEVAVEVLPSDYPAGRPTRLAYLDATGVFRVVEATSGEKGPFLELARGDLKGTLGITFEREGVPWFRVELLDWAAQASTALSPTAGWGVAQNALEFTRRKTGVWLVATYAATSVGRGWDSVGHAAGTYRGRVRLVPLAR